MPSFTGRGSSRISFPATAKKDGIASATAGDGAVGGLGVWITDFIGATVSSVLPLFRIRFLHFAHRLGQIRS